MQNFIEVVFFNDQSMIDGLIHGAYHRSKQDAPTAKHAKCNNLFLIDVTEQAAHASLYMTLKSKMTPDIIPVGIYDSTVRSRGHTMIRPTYILSDNLNVLPKEKLISALQKLLVAIDMSTRSTGTQSRIVVSEYLREKFSYCVQEAMLKSFNDKPRPDSGVFPNVDELEPNITAQEITEAFIDSNIIRENLSGLPYLILDPEVEKFLSDELITRIAGTARVNNMKVYITPSRFRKYVMRNIISMSGATV